MAVKQLISPNLSIVEPPGWCHRHARRVFGIGPVNGLDSALKAWNATKHRGSGSLPTVAVPVWFSVRSHSMGHVVTWVPGKGLLSTKPGTGSAPSAIWYTDIAAVERAFGATYLGWSYDINGVKVAEWVADPAPSKTVAQLAAEVWAGKWGNGAERTKKLTAAGYNAAAVQAEVNKGRPKPAQRTYTVQRGDTLSKIGAKFGVKWQAIYDANRKAIGSDPNRIYSGLVLVIP